jgi:hypothetical protein
LLTTRAPARSHHPLPSIRPPPLRPSSQADAAAATGAQPNLSQRSAVRSRAVKSKGSNGYESAKLNARGEGEAALQFNSGYDDGSGIQVEPQQLLIACFAFIVAVMAAHIISKFVAK